MALAPGSKGFGDRTKEIVRRIVRSHSDGVRSCYELSRRPGLAGTIDVQFTIGPSGEVIASDLQRSTVGDARVESCVVGAVRRLPFPMPVDRRPMVITYPFVVPRPEVIKRAGPNGAGAVEIEPFDSTLYVHRSTGPDAIPSNGLIAVTERGLLLVDTAWTVEETDAILAWGDGHFRRPWIGAVITHEHADRDGGLAALERRQIPVAALDLTVAKLAARGVRGVATLFLARDRFVADPRGFEAFYPGRGHAPDNIVLAFPGIIYGGCLVKSMAATDLGFTGDADRAAWPDAIRNVLDRYGRQWVVPGHGPLDPSGQALQHTLDLLANAKN
jgi:metallo-beta-lactamase class B